MTRDELIDYLIKIKHVIKIGEEYFYKETKEVKTIKQFCKNLPEKYIGVSVAKAYDFFMNDCEIPLNGSIESKKDSLYLLRSKTKESEKVFKEEILYNPEIDYVSLVTNIKSFYKKSTTKYTVVRLLTEGFWKGFLTTQISTNDEYVDNM